MIIYIVYRDKMEFIGAERWSKIDGSMATAIANTVFQVDELATLAIRVT